MWLQSWNNCAPLESVGNMSKVSGQFDLFRLVINDFFWVGKNKIEELKI